MTRLLQNSNKDTVMSKLEELIQRYCPDGVEWKPLSELGDFYSGLTGKTKEDFRDGNAKFITYVNIFNNPSLKTDVEERVKIVPGEKQNTIQYGDILFTGSSETPDECGMCSVLTHHTNEKLYLNSFCFGFRFNDLSDKNPDFMKHLFRSSDVRKDICKTANGVTRYNISKKEFAKIEIPIPPLPAQEEIVRVLDTFTELQAELQAELQKRLQQYNYYRDNLLSFEGRTDVEWKRLGDMVVIGDGLHGTPEYSSDTGCYFINGNNLHNGIIVFDDNTKQISEEEFERIKVDLDDNTLLMSINGTIGNIAYYKNEHIALGKSAAYFKVNPDFISKEYLYYYLQSSQAHSYYEQVQTGSTIKNLGLKSLREMAIPVPSLPEQERIASILNRFDTITNDLTQGLPAEMTARKMQYEYYRDTLLSFRRSCS